MAENETSSGWAEDPAAVAKSGAGFRTTHWSVVLNAADAASPEGALALEALCRSYWRPLYGYVRRRGRSPEDAKDITQDFFARLLRLESLRSVAREKGRFRTFLLSSMNHFLCDVADHAGAAKRGGGWLAVALDDPDLDAEGQYGGELASADPPEKLFDRQWAVTVLNNALSRLQEEWGRAGKEDQFHALKGFLASEVSAGTYEILAPKLSMTPRAVSMAVCRMRQRYFEWIRAEVAMTVVGPADIDSEVDYLLEVLGQ